MRTEEEIARQREWQNRCYTCRYREPLPGDCHSRCTAQKHSPLPANAIRVRGEFRGVRRGWFEWPNNFDPVWLRGCTAYEPEKGVQPDPTAAMLVSNAAEAVERMSEDELEAFATLHKGMLCAHGVPLAYHCGRCEAALRSARP